MIQIIFVLLVILHALENVIRIKKRNKRHDYRKLHHPTELIKYTIASIIVSIFGYYYYQLPIWELGLLAWLSRGTFFAISMNLFRKLLNISTDDSLERIDYENHNSGSTWDWVSRFLPFWHKQIIFTSLWIILLLATMQKG